MTRGVSVLLYIGYMTIASYAFSRLQSTAWAPSSLVPLATMLRDLTLPLSTRRALVRSLYSCFSALDPNQMPALTYQLLLLADTDGKPEVLRALHEHFEEQQEKIKTLVDDNRWLRRRVAELEARLAQ